MKLHVPRIIEAPDDATHYHGDVDGMDFYKSIEIGAAGTHWFYWNWKRKEWMMSGHHQPNWTQPIPEEWKK